MNRITFAVAAMLFALPHAHAEPSGNFLEGVIAIEVTMTRDRGGLRGMVDDAAHFAGVPARLAHAVIRQESNYNPRLRGAAGEWGLGQIKCASARDVGFRGSCRQLAGAATNLRYAMAYLRRALDRGGQGCAGVSLYQRGVHGRASCSGYGRRVMARAGR